MMRRWSGKGYGGSGVARAMRRRCALVLVIALAGCRSESTGPTPMDTASASASSAPAASASAYAAAPSASAERADAGPAQLMTDAELGALMRRLSERPGDFASHNYVSNETSYLDVAAVLRDPRMRGRAYVGVGPEQNLTYVGLMQPAIAYVVDIRRGNAVEHMVLRSCMERGATRVGFVSALTSRRVPECLIGREEQATVGEMAEAFRATRPDSSLRDGGRAAAEATMSRLGWVPTKADRADLASILGAFEAKGMELAYSMEGSARKYPSMANLLAMTAGETGSFLATEEDYRRVREFVLANRLVPVIGDFAGPHALKAVGMDMAQRKLQLGVFYTSNVEQYLFDGGQYRRFVASVGEMPRDDASMIVRVWFDQGRRHPRQKQGHRTTTLFSPASRFIERAGAKPFRSYWEVVTEE